MFKNLNLYRIASSWMPDPVAMQVQLLNAQFAPCGPTQDKSVGWVPPRGEANGALVESINGQRILRLRIETKAVPSAVVKKKAQEAADHIEATTGRKPGKKEMRELKEDALMALLPKAFEKQSDVWVWIDPSAGLLCTDASSQGKRDEVETALVNAFPDLGLRMLQTTVSPQTAMTQWLTEEDPSDWPGAFSIERACELVSGDEEKSVVKFNRHNLVTEEVREHISQGKLPKWTAMSFAGRVGFVLTENLALRKIEFLDGVFDREDAASLGDRFDTDVALATGELKVLIPALVEALGGEVAVEGGAA